MDQVVSESASKADINNHVDTGVDHQEHVVDVPANEQEGGNVEPPEGVAMLEEINVTI